MKQFFIVGKIVTVLALVAGFAQAGDKVAKTSDAEIPEGKRTSLRLYLTASEAYHKWEANPELVRVLDVRTLEEHIFIGHAEMAWNIPLAIQTHEWDAENARFSMKMNPAFVSQVKDWAELDDTILVMCRSGGRSARAVDVLAEAGFTQVYNIIDGMEGDTVKDPDSRYHGKRMRNGWKNSGLPWTYELHPERIQVPASETPSDRSNESSDG